MYTQNEEEKYILEYFAGQNHGTLLSIGENDGKTFSNALKLLELKWTGVLVEPSPSAFEKMKQLHTELNSDVLCICAAIGGSNKRVILHESGPHLKDKSDFSLLSTTKPSEMDRWNGRVEFNPIEVDQITFEELTKISGTSKFDFISIDAEGMDIEILKQINLSDTKMICIEWNGKHIAKDEIIEYCAFYGIKQEIYINEENIILAR